ncbi:DUF4411 family protein [Bacterioplanoides sp.]|uniref:DUF4411 family protein n=1 Tax=Bacterioplanoides sp. TaxID=2066072 RepID=UPI003B00E2FA
MYVIDSSSLVSAWDNYPFEQFPQFWQWFKEQVVSTEIYIPEVVVDEVSYKFPDCGEYVKGFTTPLAIDAKIISYAMTLKSVIGVNEDHYHPKGVDENDLLIISSAFCTGRILITDEHYQVAPPKEKSKAKIPLVCKMAVEEIRWTNLISYIRESGQIF